jgi:hypothetical protein
MGGDYTKSAAPVKILSTQKEAIIIMVPYAPAVGEVEQIYYEI